jgi:hypothetical protein
MTAVQATHRAQQRSTTALVAQYIRELAEPRHDVGLGKGPVRVIPNGAEAAETGSS